MKHDERKYGLGGGMRSSGQNSTSSQSGVPGKTTLTMGLPPVQRKAALDDRAVQMRERDAQSASDVQEAAAVGVSGTATDRIQRLFGRPDASGVQAPAAIRDAIGADSPTLTSQIQRKSNGSAPAFVDSLLQRRETSTGVSLDRAPATSPST